MTDQLPLQDIINGVVAAIKPEIEALKDAINSSRPMRKRKEGPTCKGFTASGKPCSNGCAEGTEFCRMHSIERQERKKKVPSEEPVVKNKPPKEKKILTEHTHTPLETDAACVPCQVHGDVFTERAVENFNIEEGLEERLKEILDSCPELMHEPVD